MHRHSGLILVAVGVCALTSCSLGMFGVDTVSFRPSTAKEVDSVDCLAENIYTPLTGLWPWDPAVTPATPDPGFPSRSIRPTEVVRCERGISGSGQLTVDTVVLDGDITAVVDAYSVKSVRYGDHISASCARAPELPAGLWLVADDGRAYRPAWPSGPCGFQEGPLEPLSMLDEVSRTFYPTGVSVDTLSCTPGFADDFQRTTADDIAESVRYEVDVQETLMTPIDDVGALRLCRYPAGVGEPEEKDKTLLTLDRLDSASMVRALADAPVAEPCARDATRLAATTLLRPDGSGGAPVSFELDGCTRVAGLGAYRQIPPGVLGVLLSQR